MVISDKEAFRVLGLPLGVDRDAIRERYKQLSTKYSSSKLPEDKRKLEQVTAAFSQLIPQSQRQLATQHHQPCGIKNKNTKAGKQIIQDLSSDDEIYSKGKNNNNNIKNGNIKNDLENKDRRKADKKKAKKKKQKEKKKQEKSENSPPENNYNKKIEESFSESEDDIIEEVQGIDPNSAFVAMVGKKIGGTSSVNSNISNNNNNNINHNNSNNSNNSNNNNNNNNNTTNSIRNEDSKKIKNNEKSQVLLEARQIQSRQLAMRGNEEANKGEYKRAIHLFTEAIRLDPNDHRFFGNRSYCYGQLHQYIEALKDADKAIKLSPEWPKGHFRKGRALKGLGKLQESEEAFKQVLQYDPGCEDALQEITRVRKKRLVDMGFTDLQARAAIKKYIQVQPALDALLNGEFQNSENIFFSDDDDDVEEEETVYQPPPKPKDVKMNPKNLEGLTSLWVGNVVPDVTEKILTKLFSKYGHVTSVRQLKEKYCAFVNFADKKAAGNAMEGLQSCELYGSKLLIKFPDNPIINGSQNIIIRKNNKSAKTTTTNNSSVSQITQTEPSTANTLPAAPSSAAAATAAAAAAAAAAVKVRGPVNGDECYFWRTTGCGFAESCKYNHIPKNKGIDKKPWQK